MRTKNTIVTALIVFLAPIASSHAILGLPKTIDANPAPTKKMKDHDRDHRIDNQQSLQGFSQGILHKVALVDEDNGRIVSNDPSSFEAQMAETNGDAVFCGIAPGTLNIVREGSEIVLVGSGHGFYDENGEVRSSYVHPKTGETVACDNSFGMFFPDFHYGANNSHGIDHEKGYRFELPPLNRGDAKKFKTHITNTENLNDLVVLRISDPTLLQRQVKDSSGRYLPRKTIEMLNVDHKKLLIYGKKAAKKNISFTTARDNFHSFQEVSYQEGCKLTNYKNTKLIKHTCDSGKSSSGGSINLRHKGSIYSLCIHYGGPGGTVDEALDPNSSKGNFCIPPQEVIKTIRKATGQSIDFDTALAVSDPVSKASSRPPAVSLQLSEVPSRLQRLLQQAGCYVGPVDNTWGPSSRNALLALAAAAGPDSEMRHVIENADEPDELDVIVVTDTVEGFDKVRC